MSRKHKSRLETLRDSTPEMLAALRFTRDILRNALNDNFFDRDVFERLQKNINKVLDLAVGNSNYVPAIKRQEGQA